MSGEYDLWLEDSRQTLIGGLRQCYYQIPEEVWQGLERRLQRGDRAYQELRVLTEKMQRLWESHPELRHQEYEGRNNMNRPPPESDG
jgi:hypothetical protein